jgi:uncharacterized protein
MTVSNAALFIAILLFVAGFISSFLPVLPGNAIVWLGVLAHKLMVGDESVTWIFFWIATGVTLLAQVLDSLCTYWGARRFGATWQGALGGLAGGIIGVIFLNIPGLIIGPIVGVVVVELYRSRNLRQAGRAGIGTVVGGFVAFVLKLSLACAVIAGFFMSLAGWF